ncbi:RING-H2 finger protein ATL13 [Manihot esculenta]|uniref:RING-type E3 ubiquitin transferase n=1 Tax=Manihot esculenta TaxID=3983 RepID=A0A2C9ULR9_MANES|nr:RING-H2 finger protein ATL13 [Manihot esculenta]OAY31877.1 hypothetical protein MANES_14G148300v8 [Manihot esculenta]
MDWVSLQNKVSTNFSPSQQPYFLAQTPPQPSLDSDGFSLNNKISPSVFLIIIILAIVFFVSGLLHLLVRLLLRPPSRNPDDLENVTALQGQLQQLFHLHDSGVDQSFIDTLPVFQYKAIIGLKNPFDCAVCLCEFEPEDELRLLPKCSHAFHMECIDTWLLSHSTCPLCRGCLLPDFSPNNTCSPIVIVLESSESPREILTDRENNIGRTSSVLTTNSHLCIQGDNDLGSSRIDFSQKSCEIARKDDCNPRIMVDSGEKVVPVKLGKFKNVDIGEGSSNNSKVDERRCFSMGSFEYVMDENCSLQVALRTPLKKKQSNKKPSLPLTPGHRPAMSECDLESRRELHGFEGSNRNSIDRSRRESFSISKIWLRGEKEKQKSTGDSSRRAFSFRFPVNKNAVAGSDLKVKNGNSRRTKSEIGIGRWENGGIGLSFDEENQSCNAKTPSFARRTLLWLVGRQNKVIHSNFSSNV